MQFQTTRLNTKCNIVLLIISLGTYFIVIATIVSTHCIGNTHGMYSVYLLVGDTNREFNTFTFSALYTLHLRYLIPQVLTGSTFSPRMNKLMNKRAKL
jgi:hypothetical protein